MPYIKYDNIAMVLLKQIKTFVLLVYLRQQKYKSGYRVFCLQFYTLHLYSCLQSFQVCFVVII